METAFERRYSLASASESSWGSAAQTRNDSLSLVRMHKPEPREATGFHTKRAEAQSPSNPSKNGLKSTSKPKATGRPHSLSRKKQGALLCRSTPPKRKPFFVVERSLQGNETTVNHAVFLLHTNHLSRHTRKMGDVNMRELTMRKA